MLGTLSNVAAIIVGSLIGFLLKKGIPIKVKDTIISMVLGSAIGEFIDIDRFMNSLGAAVEKKLKVRGGQMFHYCLQNQSLISSFL